MNNFDAFCKNYGISNIIRTYTNMYRTNEGTPTLWQETVMADENGNVFVESSHKGIDGNDFVWSEDEYYFCDKSFEDEVAELDRLASL